MGRVTSLLAAVSIVLAACGGAATPSTSASASASVAAASPTKTPAPLVKLKVSYSNVVGDEIPVWIALEGGYFKANGLDVEIVNIASAQGIPAIVAGEVQVGQLGGSEVMSAAAGGADLVVVGMLAGVYPFVFVAAPEIKTVADLKGKKIGVSSVGSSSDIATRVGLRKVGLDPEKDVTIITVGSAQARTAALLSGAIVGGVVQPPDQLVLEEKGFNRLFNLAELKLPSANTSVTVKRTYLAQNRDIVQRYVDSLVQAIAREKKDKAFTISVLKKYFKSDDDKVMGATYDFFALQVVNSNPEPTVLQFADALATLTAQNDKLKGFDPKTMIDATLVADAIKRGLDKQ